MDPKRIEGPAERDPETESTGGRCRLGSAAIRRGWAVGKKAAIVGAALTAAPVLVPPLLLLSVVSLALSVPFGLCLVGFASADRLMRALSPSPPVEYGDEEEEGQEFLEMLQRRKLAEESDMEEANAEEEGRGETQEVGESKEREEGRPPSVCLIASDAPSTREDVTESETSSGSTLESFTAVVEDGSTPRIASSTVENISDELQGKVGRSEDIGDVQDNVSNVAWISKEHVGLVEENKVKFEEAEAAMLGEKNMEVVGSGVPTNGEGQEDTCGLVAVMSKDKDDEIEPGSYSSEYASAVEEQSSELADTESRCSIEHTGGIKESSMMVHVETQISMLPDDEILQDVYNEQLLRKQITALRTIIGYKARPLVSLADELSALCLFTGIEPPASARDASCPIKLNYILQLLKSVIGVG